MIIKKSINNRKGFTLIELLVTISIMLSILGIAIVSLVNISNKKKEEAYKLVTEQIKIAAEQYFDSNEYLFEGLSADAYGIITVGKLVKEDYLNKVTDPRTGYAISNCAQVQVTKESGKYTSKFIEFDKVKEDANGDKICKSDNSITITEPGAPKIVLTPYKSDDTPDKELIPGNNNWYNSIILGTADLAIYVEGKTNGNGPIKAIYKCGSNFEKCQIPANVVYKGNNASYEDKDSYKEDAINKTSCYQVTNISGKIAKKCTTKSVDKTPPTCGIRAVGDSKKAITPYNPTGTVETSNNSSYDGWFTSNVRVFVESSDKISFVKEGSQTVTINGRKYTNVKGESNGVNEQANKDTNGKDIMFSVEDNAGNKSNCKITLKRDTTPPICGIRAAGTAKKAITPLNPFGIVNTYNTEYNVDIGAGKGDNLDERSDITPGTKNFSGWFTSPVNVYISSDDYGSGGKYNVIYENDSNLNDIKNNIDNIIANEDEYNKYLSTSFKDDTSGQNFYGYAEDNAGNWSSCGVEVKKDTTAPICRVTKSPVSGKNDWYIDNPTINLSSSDGVSGVDKDTLYYWKVEDPKALIKAGKDTDTRTLNWDTNYVGYAGYVVDNAGNEVNGDCYVEVRRDTTAPTCELKITEGTLGNNGWYISKNVSIDISASDGGDDNKKSGIWYKTFYNEGEEGNLANNTKTPDSNTRYQTADTANSAFYGYAKDNAGNWSSCQINVKKDATIPYFTFINRNSDKLTSYSYSNNEYHAIYSGGAPGWDPAESHCGLSGCQPLQVMGCARDATGNTWKHDDWSTTFLKKLCATDNSKHCLNDDNDSTKNYFKYKYKVCSKAGLCSDGNFIINHYYEGNTDNNGGCTFSK